VKAIDSGGLHAIFAAFDLVEEGQVVTIDEEEAARQAQAVVSSLSTSAPNPNIVATLRKATAMATGAMTGEGSLNEARHTVANALSDLIHAIEHGPLTQEKIAQAKDAIEDWLSEVQR
jgi:hypothetical protein